MLRGLFEGAQYNSEAGAKRAVYSKARTKQGRGVIKEIRYVINKYIYIHVCIYKTYYMSQSGIWRVISRAEGGCKYSLRVK